MGIIVIVTGGRTYADAKRVHDSLNLVHAAHHINLVVQGGCPTGADAHARAWAMAMAVDCRTYAADWLLWGKAAGPMRNTRMIRDSKADLVLAFPGGRGTADCVRKAEAAGIPVNPSMLALGTRLLSQGDSNGSV